MNRIKRALLLIICTLGWSTLVAGPVDVNSADAETISAELTGVGLSRATAIVEYRRLNGPFKSADELLNVKGIGERTLELNRDNILLKPVSGKPSN